MSITGTKFQNSVFKFFDKYFSTKIPFFRGALCMGGGIVSLKPNHLTKNCNWKWTTHRHNHTSRDSKTSFEEIVKIRPGEKSKILKKTAKITSFLLLVA